MPPPHHPLDPEGYYGRLGLAPSANRAEIVTAFRTLARVFHPDVPKTGNADAFVALKQAYDILSNAGRRAAYDRSARQFVETEPPPASRPVRRAVRPRAMPDPLQAWEWRYSRQLIAVFAALAVFVCVGLFEIYSHLTNLPRVESSGIRPNAEAVEPLSAQAHRALLYGPPPIRLPGTPNFYVRPSGSPATVWREDPAQRRLVPLGQLPPFSVVQAIRLVPETGMLEILVNEKGSGFIAADRLVPGDIAAARLGYCSYNAGPPPFDGEMLEHTGTGAGTLSIENKASEPMVLKLRGAAGDVVLSVFLSPGGQVSAEALPDGDYRADYAVGEMWSRACNMFVASMHARRMRMVLHLPGDKHLTVSPDHDGAVDISAGAFVKN